MKVHVSTASGAQYTFDHDDLTWERVHVTRDIIGLGSRSDGRTTGHLVEWPAIITGIGIMFDDVDCGVVYTTRVLATRVSE